MEPSTLVLAATLLPVAGLASARTPRALVEETNNRVIALYAGQASDAVPARVLAVIDSVTDFDVICKRALDKHRARQNSDELAEFDRTFTRLLRATSVRKMGRYRASRYTYLGEEIRAGRAVVRTLAFHDKEEIPVDYELVQREGEWKIVNYVVDGVDTVANYRRQFDRLLARETLSAVIARLRRKIAEHEAAASGAVAGQP